MQSVVIASVNKHQYSETFIHNHVEGLPYDVHYLYGGYLPAYYGDDFPLAAYYHPVLHRFYRRSLELGIFNYFKEYKVAAVLAEYGPVGVSLLPVCREAKIPLLVYFHGFDIYRADILRDYLDSYQEVFHEATMIFAVSRDMVARLIELGAPARKVVLNPCGANLSLFRYHEAGRNEKTLLAASRFEATKNPLATIEAFAIALATVPGARLRMAGTGSLFKKASRLVRLLKIEGSVEFLGVLSPIEVSEEMAMARAFVQHSTTTEDGGREGSPVALMEAGASGLPVVATRHTGIKDIIVENQTGYLVDEGDVPAMARYMVDLLLDPNRATVMGTAARQRIVQYFSLEKNIRTLCQYIERVI